MDDFAGLSLGGPSTNAPGPVQQTSGNDLLAGLNFSSTSTTPFSLPTPQQQQPFYQQYQTPLPANLSAGQQQSMSWGNMNSAASPSSSGSLAPTRQGQGATMSPPLMQGQGNRSSTPGAITLGMMGSVPGTPTSANGGFGQFAQAPMQAQQSQSQQRQQPPQQAAKPKDPFDDLLSL